MSDIKTITVQAHVRDTFYATLKDGDGKVIHVEDGYVPRWMAGSEGGGGDDFTLEIDNKTGQILNWKEITKDQLDIEGEDEAI
jgi:hypothetical protein